ncbi:MAG TPA: TIGR01777 family oxidoreductase [Nitriliruptorales bacterium]|nr:TIGR01777 family oxidoreductase [Nitriliruptorales bacterium]
MDVVVSGSSGLIGSALCQALEAAGHHPVRLVRSDTAGPEEVRWDPTSEHVEAAALEGIDVVVHLAGEPLLGRWTAAKKRRIRDSRVEGTHLLAGTLAGLQRPPRALLSGSGIGYYGADHGDELLPEDTPPGDDFLARVCKGWEAATQPAEEAGIRVVRLRTAPVLSPDGDLLRLQLPFFRLGLGGKLGSGQHWFSWISLEDHVRAQLHLLEHPVAAGPVNITAPTPVRNAEFARTLGRVLGRPVLLTVPTLAVATLFGRDFADVMATASQRAIPKRLLDEFGFAFRHQTVEEALRAELQT